MPAHITRPASVLPRHKVSTQEILDDIRSHHADHPRLGAILRIVAGVGVDTRYFCHPLDSPVVAGDAGITERAESAFADALRMGQDAALLALDTAGIGPGDVDALITSHSTSWAVPGLDVHLTNRLGLPPGVRRFAMTTLACGGGVQALIRAAELACARPGSKVLVVVSEVISAVYNHRQDSMQSMIYKALFGDSAAACVVSTERHGPGLTVEHPVGSDSTLELLLPDTTDRYRGRIDERGLHFDSTKAAKKAADASMPHLRDWLSGASPDFAVIHPGSPVIIDDVATGLGLAPADTRHSRELLAEEGNRGGPSILGILERFHNTPPADGDSGVAVAFSPGFAVSALRGTWRN
ncbi:PhlD [Streptomyces sp. NPDC058045]|uniref:PhlD n=1 Tax=Streptomyces sp. NPDC058045 TaxID=3346311 RepID=UPI0036F17AEA